MRDRTNHCASQVRPRQSAATHTWPGRDIGVRAPDAGEIALSYEEVQTGVACEIFDGWPMLQRVCPAGSWERSKAGLLAKPSHGDGLL